MGCNYKRGRGLLSSARASEQPFAAVGSQSCGRAERSAARKKKEKKKKRRECLNYRAIYAEIKIPSLAGRRFIAQ